MLTAIGCFFVITLAWVFRGVYRKWPLDIIEASCILNLGLLAVVTNYIMNDSTNNHKAQLAVVYISVGTVFILFVVVLVYQAYKQLTTSDFWQKCVSSLSIRKSESRQSLEEPVANQMDGPNPELWPHESSDMTEQLLPPVVRFDRYREPILEFEDELA